MNYTNVTNLQWVDAGKTALSAMVDFEGLGVVPFCATSYDPEPHGQDIFQRAVAGDFGPVADYVPPTQTLGMKFVELVSATKELINSTAVAQGFDSIDEAMTYVDESAVPEYQTKALALRKWRSLVWEWYDTVYAAQEDFVLADVMSKMPTL